MIKVLTSLHVKANSGGEGDADDGHQYSSLGDSARTKAFVRKLFNKVDKDHSGRLTYMEFLQASLKYPALVEMVLPAAGVNTEGGADGEAGKVAAGSPS